MQFPEMGICSRRRIITGADHTCTYGAGSVFQSRKYDTAAGRAAQRKAWFKVPAATKVELTGNQTSMFRQHAILHLIGQIGVDGALYKSLEYGGDSNPFHG